MSKVLVSVTAEDIRSGKPRDPDKCPIVLALRRRFKSYKVINVSKDEVFFARRENGPGEWYCLPEVAVEFLSRFHGDGREVVEPFTFEISRPVT
jgi:hypothetical protein